VATPRSGNSWLKYMLAQALDLTEVVALRPLEFDWSTLPRRALLNTHWLPDERLRRLLADHGCRVVVMARHPLDVLVSILVFSQHDDSSSWWLGGCGGDEQSIAGASPSDDAFLAYARGSRARALLAVSGEWWSDAHACRVRYEDLVEDTAGEVNRV